MLLDPPRCQLSQSFRTPLVLSLRCHYNNSCTALRHQNPAAIPCGLGECALSSAYWVSLSMVSLTTRPHRDSTTNLIAPSLSVCICECVHASMPHALSQLCVFCPRHWESCGSETMRRLYRCRLQVAKDRGISFEGMPYNTLTSPLANQPLTKRGSARLTPGMPRSTMLSV